MPCLFSFKWKQNVQEFTSQGQVSDTPPSRLYPGTPTLHQGLVCNNLSWWGGHFIYRFLCAQRLCKNPHFFKMKGNICTIKALLIIQPWGHKFSRGGQACITVCETSWAPQGLESQASAPQRQRGLRTSFSYLPKMRRNLPAGCSSTELIVGGCCKLCSMLQTSNSNTVLLLESWDADSVCVCASSHMCACMFVFLCVHLCECIYAICVCLCAFMFICLYVCVHLSACLFMCMHLFAVSGCMIISICVYICVSMSDYIYAFVSLYIIMCVHRHWHWDRDGHLVMVGSLRCPQDSWEPTYVCIYVCMLYTQNVYVCLCLHTVCLYQCVCVHYLPMSVSMCYVCVCVLSVSVWCPCVHVCVYAICVQPVYMCV